MRTIKLFIVLTVAFGVLTFSSCKKSKDDTNVSYYITADIDGKATSFNTNATATVASVEGHAFTIITGTAKDGTNLSITLSGTAITGKTYSDAAANDEDKPLILFTPPGNNADSFLNNDDDASNLPSVTITSISSGKITGTFKGWIEGGIALGGSNDLPKKLITNGKFSLSYSK